MTTALLISRTYYYDRDYGYTKSWFKGQNLGLASQALPQLAWLIPSSSPSLQPPLCFPTHLHSHLLSILNYILPPSWGHPGHMGLTPTGERTHSGNPKPVIKQEREAAAEASLSLSGLSTHAKYFPNVISFKACNHPLKKSTIIICAETETQRNCKHVYGTQSLALKHGVAGRPKGAFTRATT